MLGKMLVTMATGTAAVEMRKSHRDQPSPEGRQLPRGEGQDRPRSYDGVVPNLLGREEVQGGHGRNLPSWLGGGDCARHFNRHYEDGYIQLGATPNLGPEHQGPAEHPGRLAFEHLRDFGGEGVAWVGDPFVLA